MEDNTVLRQHARNARRNIVKMVANAKSGHPGGSLSAIDVLTYLYFNVMNIEKENLTDIDRDKFVLSKGHASPALYAVLAEKGFIEEEELMTFRLFGSRLQGHPTYNPSIGVDMSTGSLGQGISVAVGMAKAAKMKGTANHIYTMIGDGESEEGQVWEALMAAAHHKLDNLTVILDYNHLQIDGNIADVIGPEPYPEKFNAFGLHVIECDGHDFDSIAKAFEEAASVTGKPCVIIANTVKGKGVSFMENQANWHGVAPNEEQLAAALAELEGEDE